MGLITHLFVCLRHRLPMMPVEEIKIVANQGLRGCAHGRPGSRRQVLLMARAVLEELQIEPGALKENITVRGLRLCGIRPGERIQAGSALLEACIPCEPCKRMDDLRPGLQEQLRGRRGLLCRVLEGGWVRRGDSIEVAGAVPLSEEGSVKLLKAGV